jgi:hypothetical protein
MKSMYEGRHRAKWKPCSVKYIRIKYLSAGPLALTMTQWPVGWLAWLHYKLAAG